MPSQTAAFARISPESTGAASTLYNAQRQLGSARGMDALGTVPAAIGTVTSTAGGTPTANLAAYRAAFLVASALALVAAVTALFVRDSDAFATMDGGRECAPEREPAGASAP